jgi:hypothetical protein
VSIARALCPTHAPFYRQAERQTTVIASETERIMVHSARSVEEQAACFCRSAPSAVNIGTLPAFISIKVEVALAMTIRIISILAVAIMIGPLLASGSPACMTESEERTKFPKAHLIWFGPDHCWTFGVVPVHSRRPVLAAEPVPSLRPVPAAEPSPRPVVQCQYSPCE